jgi:hypothetical protein
MIFSLGNFEHAIPLDTHFPPSVSRFNQTTPEQRVRQLSHARKLAKAKNYLRRRGIASWTNWKDSTPG